MGGVAVAAAVLIALVAVGAGATGTGQPATPHYVEEAVAAGLDHRYDGDFQYFVGGGVATFDCNDDGLPDVYLAGGSGPAALFENRQPDRRGAPLRAGREPGHRPRRGHRRLPARRRRRRHHRPRGAPGRRERAPARAGRLPLRARQRGAGPRRRQRLDGGVLGDLGGREHAADAGVRAVRDRRRRAATRPTPARPTSSSGPTASGTRYARADGPRPGWCALSMLFSDWSRSGRADLRVSNDRHYYTDASGGEEQLWRIAPGEQPRLYTDADGWQTLRIWGMGIASQDITGDGYPEVYLTSQADNKLQTLAAGPSQPDVPRHRARARRDRDHAVHGRRHARLDRLAPPVRGRQQRHATRTCFVTKGNVEAEADMAAKDPTQPVPRPAGRDVPRGAPTRPAS